MCDDMNSPQAIAVLFELTRLLNSLSIGDPRAGEAYACLLELGEILGILRISPLEWFKTPRIRVETESVDGLLDEQIDQLLEQRQQARKDKDWALADQIRDRLLENSIFIEDRDGKTVWRRK